MFFSLLLYSVLQVQVWIVYGDNDTTLLTSCLNCEGLHSAVDTGSPKNLSK